MNRIGVARPAAVLARLVVLGVAVGAAFASPHPALAALRCYVDADAPGVNNGTSWYHAYTELQSALTNPACTEIWVAEGLYKPVIGPIPGISFEIPPGVSVYGGFASGETLLQQRDWQANVTVLSGDIDNNDTTNANGVVLDDSGISGINSLHVVLMDGTSTTILSSTILDGFTITAGNADNPLADYGGGGLWCDGHGINSVCSPTLRHLVFSGNMAVRGGAIFCSGGPPAGGVCSPTLEDVTFSGNAATDWGGAMYTYGVSGNSTPHLTDVTFSSNSAAAGGAMYNEDSTPTLTKVAFLYNVASYGGGAMLNASSGPTLTNVTFAYNYATDGAAMSTLGDTHSGVGAVLTNVTFSHNYAFGSGGALFTYSIFSPPVLVNVILWGDSAYLDGSEIYNDPALGGSEISHSIVQGGCPTGSTCASITTLDPALGALVDYGGPTQTMPLLAGSSAINAGHDSSCPDYDQRGVRRPQGPHCDIGAYERIPAAADFDGSYASNVVVYSGGAWQFYDFTSGAYLPGSSVWTGGPGSCIPAPMDYDGDGRVEFTQLCGNAWHFYNDNGNYNKGIWIGLPGAVPVPADFNGDGTDDVVVFAGGAWQSFNFATGAYDAAHSVWTGLPAGGGTPAAMDYDGDDEAEPTILSTSGAWHFYNDNGSYHKGIWIGMAGASPVPGDYSGDGTEQPVVFGGGAWQFFDYPTGAYDGASSVWTGLPAPVGSGVAGPAPLDYDGDGMLDFTYYAGGAWHFYNADGGYNKGIWTGGAAGDEAISRRQLP